MRYFFKKILKRKKTLCYTILFLIISLITCNNIFYKDIKKISNTHTVNSVLKAKVVRVIDGDTIEVMVLNDSKFQNIEKVRFIGVDTPETKHPKKKVQYFGQEASAYTKKILSDKEVLLKFDETTRDKYGRLLCYVIRMEDNYFVNLMLIYNGYGYAYTKFPFKYKKEFVEAEKLARHNKVGLWADKK